MSMVARTEQTVSNEEAAAYWRRVRRADLRRTCRGLAWTTVGFFAGCGFVYWMGRDGWVWLAPVFPLGLAWLGLWSAWREE